MTPLAILMIMLNVTHYNMNYQEHFFGVNNREHLGNTALISVTQYVTCFFKQQFWKEFSSGVHQWCLQCCLGRQLSKVCNRLQHLCIYTMHNSGNNAKWIICTSMKWGKSSKKETSGSWCLFHPFPLDLTHGRGKEGWGRGNVVAKPSSFTFSLSAIDLLKLPPLVCPQVLTKSRLKARERESLWQTVNAANTHWALMVSLDS